MTKTITYESSTELQHVLFENRPWTV